MKARQRKKNSKKEDEKRKVNISEARCPKCSGKDGIIGIFVDGSPIKATFLYCSGCEYSYKLKEEE